MEISRRHVSDFTRLFDILSYQREKYPNQCALNAFEAGNWKGLSIYEIQAKVDSVSCWFIRHGYLPGQTVILVPVMGTPEWMILDFACQQCGLVTIPMHPTTSPQDIELIITETDAKICIAANVSLSEAVKAVTQKINSLISVHHLDLAEPAYFEPLQFTKPNESDLEKLERTRNSINEYDLATILYTSGSSGVPKGVLLTHRNIVCNIKAVLTLLPLGPGDRVLSFLPFSHILERVACYGYMAFGVSLYFSQSKESFEHDFRTVRPFFCTSVPRILEKMYEFLQQQLLERNWVKRVLIAWALAVGKQYGSKDRFNGWYALKLYFARVLVLSHWRKKLGGRIRYMIVGAASLQPEIGRLFSAAGISVVEGYGMTETAPLITINRYEPGLTRFGTVGLPIPGVEVKIDEPNREEEGEILVKGANVMQGYFKRPDLTEEAFTKDGWFRTGDIGKFVHRHFLKITDRKKDIFKTSSGKYIAPLPLQTHFTKSPFIERCLIIGFQRPFVTALIVANVEILETWCEREHIHWTSLQFMVHNIKVRDKLQLEISTLNESLPSVERVNDFVLCPQDWTVDRGELTNTLKPVRQVLMVHYEKEIDKMYL